MLTEHHENILEPSEDAEVDVLEERDYEEQVPDKEADREIKAVDVWQKMMDEAQDVAVTNLTFAEPIKTTVSNIWEMGLSAVRELMAAQLK